MKVIKLQETITRHCSCGVSLLVEANDIQENWKNAEYFFKCSNCQKYHKIDYNTLPESFKSAIKLNNNEVGH